LSGADQSEREQQQRERHERRADDDERHADQCDRHAERQRRPPAAAPCESGERHRQGRRTEGDRSRREAGERLVSGEPRGEHRAE
jgi:hypothetical protein